MADLNEFQSKIGYTFKNQHLLEQALTHSSYANEKHMKKHSDNERLEFLGDAVLEIVSSEFLFINYPQKPEGELTKVCAQALFVSRLLHFVQSHLTLESTYVLAGARIIQVAERENRFFLMHLRQ